MSTEAVVILASMNLGITPSDWPPHEGEQEEQEEFSLIWTHHPSGKSPNYAEEREGHTGGTYRKIRGPKDATYRKFYEDRPQGRGIEPHPKRRGCPPQVTLQGFVGQTKANVCRQRR